MTDSENRITRAAGQIMVAMFVSRILGYLRDVVIYARFGQNRITDAYIAAFSIPDFLYMMLVGGALSSAFIPTISGYLATDREKEAWEVASIIFNVVLVLILIGIFLGLIFTPQLVSYLLVPGFDQASTALTITLTRIMFVQVFFMAISGIAQGILNSYKHFLMPSIGSVLYNLGIIVLGVLLSPRFGIAAFSIGVVVGAVSIAGVQIPALLKRRPRYRFSFNLRHPGVKKIGRLMLPVFIGLSVVNFNVFVNQNLASNLAGGGVTALQVGQRLMMLPVGIFAIAIAVAIFPSLSAQVARGEMDQFRRSVSLGLRTVLFIDLPAAAGLIALAVPIVRLIYQQGKFIPEMTHVTAQTLIFYSLGLSGYAAIQLLNRVFYALQDTRTPVTTGVTTIVLNIALNFLLVGPMQANGLALAYSIAGVFNMGMLLYILRRKLSSIDGKRLAVSFLKSLVASVLMGLTSYAAVEVLGRWLDMASKANQALQVGVGVLVGVAGYVFLARAFRMEEGAMVWGMLTSRLRRRPKTSQQP
ncbi:MAG: murein biosynthesis integral membrane protein MurJ [Bacillota bacterium]